MEKRKSTFWIATVAVFGLLALAVGANVFVVESGQSTGDIEGISTFEDAEEFRRYLARAPSTDGGLGDRVQETPSRSVDNTGAEAAAPRQEPEQQAPPREGGAVKRESDTNVQVEGSGGG